MLGPLLLLEAYQSQPGTASLVAAFQSNGFRSLPGREKTHILKGSVFQGRAAERGAEGLRESRGQPSSKPGGQAGVVALVHSESTARSAAQSLSCMEPRGGGHRDRHSVCTVTCHFAWPLVTPTYESLTARTFVWSLPALSQPGRGPGSWEEYLGMTEGPPHVGHHPGSLSKLRVPCAMHQMAWPEARLLPVRNSTSGTQQAVTWECSWLSTECVCMGHVHMMCVNSHVCTCVNVVCALCMQ